MKDSLRKNIGLGFGAAIVALVLIGGAAWWSAARFKGTVYWVNHTYEAINTIARLQSDVLGMQANVRGYVLTGDEAMLAPYNAGSARIDDELARLRTLLADNPKQMARVDTLAPTVERAREIMRGRIANRRARGLDAAAEAPFFAEGQRAVEAIRRLAGELETEERRLMEDRFGRMNKVGKVTMTTIVLAVLLSILVLSVAALVSRREVSRRTQTEEALRQREEHLRLMISSVSDYAIVQLDPEGNVQGWNTGAERIKGYTADEIVGQHFSRFYPPEALQAGAPQKLLLVAAAEGRVQDEGWRVRRDGSRLWANVVITAIRDPEGTLLGFVKVTRDLTERRAAEEKIRQLNEDLLRRATALETANQELEAFSYSVSHDLRAPLRHIDGFTNLLAKQNEGKLDAQSARYLEVISRAARQMGALIDDLLAFSRVGRTPMRVETIDQTQLVKETIAEARYERPVAWEIGALPVATGDPALLRQVWRNLLDNAVKYSGKAEAPRIVVSGHTDPERQEHIYSVRDNGVGFDMAYADKLFGVFQRLHAPSEFEGTGIGLANVRRIVGRHGGRTWAESQVDAGATFFFSLPVTPLAPPSSA